MPSLHPSLALLNPAAYRARFALMEHPQRARYVDSLNRQQLLDHMRVVEPLHLQARDGLINVLFDHVAGPGPFSPTRSDPKYLSAKRELAREAHLRLMFTIRFHSEPFTLVRIDPFIDICQKLVASAVTPQRFILRYFPELRDRGSSVEPPSVILFACLQTEHREEVQVELSRTSHPGYEDRLVSWARDRAAEYSVPFEQHGSLRKPPDDGP
jgi:hypothetical protein